MRESLLDELAAAYSAPGRHFHNLDHIRACLAELDDAIRHGVKIEDPEALRFAIWFHDLIYDGTRTDNEERSAQAARNAATELGHGAKFAAAVERLVLVTKHGILEPETPDEALICDIDLASLACSDFEGNTKRIREEYSHLPDEEFYPARRRILAGFLERPRIYRTEFFFAKYETAARQNLLRATSATGSAVPRA
jgi:predicted metal-dependent HD superfamily phosphohydrolase